MRKSKTRGRTPTSIPAAQVRMIKKYVKEHGRGGIAKAMVEFKLSRFVLNRILGGKPVRVAKTVKAFPNVAKLKEVRREARKLFTAIAKLEKLVGRL